jgi:murein DD-endopeptidase MepM/ murein hydrolase activator NlpD
MVYEGQGMLFRNGMCDRHRPMLWSCPRCRTRDNTVLLDRCRSCGYRSSNLEGLLFGPVDRGRITNSFSPRHRAIDYGVPAGSPVYAAEKGIVAGVYHDRWAGNVLKLHHEGGMESIYGHLDEILVTEGSIVSMGDIVARSGCTGISTGPHLHFEVRVDGTPVNPLDFLRVE